MSDVTSQLADYGAYHEAVEEPIPIESVVARGRHVRELPTPQSPRRRREWRFAVGSAVIALVAILPVVLFFAGGSDDGVAGTSTVSPDTTSPVPTTEGPAITEPVAAREAGSGPELSWQQYPQTAGFMSATWFGDAFYALGLPLSGGGPSPAEGPFLYRSESGFDWEPVASFAAAMSGRGSFQPHAVVSDGTRIVVSGVRGPTDEAQGCPAAAGELVVAVSDDGVGWTVTTLDVGTAVAASDVVCIATFGGPIATGPAGIMVTASTSADVDYERILAPVLGRSALTGITFLQHTDDRLVVSTTAGDVLEFSLEELGYAPEDLARPGTGAAAWWSPDGEEWHEADRSGPLGAPSLGLVTSVEDGFLVARQTLGLWKTADGSEWESVDPGFREASIFAWGGEVVAVDYRADVLRVMGGETLPMTEGLDGAEIIGTGFGEFGIAVVVSDGSENRYPTGILYSPDGDRWRRSSPSGIDSLVTSAVVVGTDRVLLLDWRGSVSFVGVPTRP